MNNLDILVVLINFIGQLDFIAGIEPIFKWVYVRFKGSKV